jgi:hypothetical protein
MRNLHKDFFKRSNNFGPVTQWSLVRFVYGPRYGLLGFGGLGWGDGGGGGGWDMGVTGHEP